MLATDAGKKNKRKAARPPWDDLALESDLLPPPKRVSSLRKQQQSRPDSAVSDDARSADKPVHLDVTNGCRLMLIPCQPKTRLSINLKDVSAISLTTSHSLLWL